LGPYENFEKSVHLDRVCI